MFLQLAYAEIVKYKRTIIPWLITLGGGFAAFVALMLVLAGDLQKSWEVFIVRGLNLINILALLLVAVISGYVFLHEYHEGIATTIFTYPVSRLKIYFTKFFIIMLMVIALFLSFFVLTLVLGLIFLGEIPSSDFLFKFIRFIFILSGANFVLSPVTVFVSIMIRGIGTYILAGMSYFLVYMGFLNSDYSLRIPPCIPDKLVANYYVSEFMSKADQNGIIVVLSITFLTALLAGAFYYSRHAA